MHADLMEIKENLLKGLADYMKDLSCADAHEAGEVVDILKDIAEIEYYEAVTAAMDEAKYDDILGYTPTRTMNPKPMAKMRTRGKNYESSMVGDYMRENYGDMRLDESSEADRYGHAYKEYTQAKRYYTESHSEKDKSEMRTQADHHVADMLASFKDIWRDADPEHKKQMKADLSAFVNQLAV